MHLPLSEVPGWVGPTGHPITDEMLHNEMAILAPVQENMQALPAEDVANAGPQEEPGAVPGEAEGPVPEKQDALQVLVPHLRPEPRQVLPDGTRSGIGHIFRG